MPLKIQPCHPNHYYMLLELFVCVGVCVCVYATGIYYIAHNHAIRPRPATLVIVCSSHWSSQHACVCVGVHLIVHDRAIRPCCPSHCILLTLYACMFIKLYITVQSDPVTSSSLYPTLVLPSGGQLYLLRKYIITCGLGDVWEYYFCGVCRLRISSFAVHSFVSVHFPI